MVFEGLVIQKVPYKERDLIVKLLLRNGHLGSFYVYGGQGGGKHHKPTIYELGSMMKVNLRDKKNHRVDGAELMVVSEGQRTWEAQVIRHDVQAFYLMCLYFEVVQKFAQPYHFVSGEYENDENEGVFSVVSNALFNLNNSVLKKQFFPEQQLTLFMIKLLFHLGIMPDTEKCSYCSVPLLETQGVTFLPANGQFACLQCVSAEDERGFWLRIKKGYQTKYSDYLELTETKFSEADKLLQYFCHQFHLRPVELKSYPLLFRN